MLVHFVQQIRIMESGPINQSPSLTMLVINKPFLVWQITGKREKPRATRRKYIGKLIHIVHFLAYLKRNNLPVKSFYQKFIEFLSNELKDPIIKQYLENCSENATYKSHETCDSLIASLDSFFWWETNKRIRRSADIVLFADKSTNAARSEMLGVFISSYDENTRTF